MLGFQDIEILKKYYGTVGEQQTTNTSRNHIERSIILPRNLNQLPLSTDEAGLTAYFKSICHPPYRGHIPAELLFFGAPFKTQEEIPHSAWSRAHVHSLSYLPLHSDSASGLRGFEGRTEDQLLFPEDHTPYLTRLGFPPGAQTTSPQPADSTATEPEDDDFDIESFKARFPRIRTRRQP